MFFDLEEFFMLQNFLNLDISCKLHLNFLKNVLANEETDKSKDELFLLVIL